MKPYHRWWTCRRISPCRLPKLVTLHDTQFVECRRCNDRCTVKTIITWQSSASMIPVPGHWCDWHYSICIYIQPPHTYKQRETDGQAEDDETNKHSLGTKTTDLAEPTEYMLCRPLLWLLPDRLWSSNDICLSAAPGVSGNLSLQNKEYVSQGTWLPENPHLTFGNRSCDSQVSTKSVQLVLGHLRTQSTTEAHRQGFSPGTPVSSPPSSV